MKCACGCDLGSRMAAALRSMAARTHGDYRPELSIGEIKYGATIDCQSTTLQSVLALVRRGYVAKSPGGYYRLTDRGDLWQREHPES